jgi:3-dehydroquinate dehydratase-2
VKILVIHGPNLNLLGRREKRFYGDKSLAELDALLEQEAERLGVEVVSFQSNSEGGLIDFIQAQSPQAAGIIINPGALTHYGLSLRDALADAALPTIEVHLSNIYAREEWRGKSVIAPVAQGQISGLGWRGYVAALNTLVAILREEQPVE